MTQISLKCPVVGLTILAAVCLISACSNLDEMEAADRRSGGVSKVRQADSAQAIIVTNQVIEGKAGPGGQEGMDSATGDPLDGAPVVGEDQPADDQADDIMSNDEEALQVPPLPNAGVQPATGRLRYVVITDMTHDDSQSLLRLLLYANDIDIEAIIVTNQRKDDDPRSTRPWSKTMGVLDAYGRALQNLRLHDARYPSKEKLLAVTRQHSGAPTIAFVGNSDKFSDYVGEGLNRDGLPMSTSATQLLKEIFSGQDKRPLHVGLWGGAVAFSQAVWEYRKEVSSDAFRAFSDRLHVFDVAAQDTTNDLFVDLSKLNTHFLRYGSSTYTGERVDAGAYTCFKNWGVYLNNSVLDVRMIQASGAPYTAGYTAGGEGDTPSFLHLLSALHGMNDPNDLSQNSWAGSYASAAAIGARIRIESAQSANTLRRWLPVALNDFVARAHRVNRSPQQVNHNPQLVVNGGSTKEPLRLSAAAGAVITLDFAGSEDPDGGALNFSAFEDQNATGRTGQTVATIATRGSAIDLRLPPVLDRPVHIVVVASDSGSPALQSYRRVIVSAN